MKKLKLIYNPFSGNKGFKFDLDTCVSIFQENGYEVHLFRSQKEGDIDKHVINMEPNYYDIIVASGGDGTVNIVINALMRAGHRIPLGIIPSGTANDFATFLGLKVGKVEEACHVIMDTEPKDIDLGVVNDTEYFINVCAGGLLTNVSQTVDKEMKNALGNLSYYIKGVEQLPNFTKLPFRITTSKEVVEDKFYLYMILNSAGTGGFMHIAPDASITDGKFDFVGIKAKPMLELPMLFFKIFSGELINDSGVVYLRDEYFKIEYLGEDSRVKYVTLDGEKGPEMPFDIKVLPKAYPVYGKFKY